jgi:hypothetical protein
MKIHGSFFFIFAQLCFSISATVIKKYAQRCEFPEKLYESLSLSVYARKKAFVLNRIDSAMVFQGMTLFQVMEDFETWTPL